MKKPLILTALEMEAHAVHRRLRADGLKMDVKAVGVCACQMPAELSGIDLVVMAGLAGGLDPALKVGDIVYDRPPHDERGGIHTTAYLAATVAAKKLLYQETGALAVDMENAIVRRASQAAGIPFVGIRAISDTADEEVDSDLLGMVDKNGKVRHMAAMGIFARRPALIPKARHLMVNSQIALKALGDAVARCVSDWREQAGG